MLSAIDASAMRDLFANLPELETNRLILRTMRMGDAEMMFDYMRDPRVAEHVLWTAHKTQRDTRSYLRCMLRQYRNGEPSSYCMVLKETGRVIGTIGFMACNADDGVVEVGYSMARPYWGQGLMTEALRCFIDMVFTDTCVHRIEARYETANPASRRVMEKCGMRYEGTHRGAVYNKDRFADAGVCAILREDWDR